MVLNVEEPTMIRVLLKIDLPEWWGAENALEDGGDAALKELCHEDIEAFLECAEWTIVEVKE